MAEFQPKKEYGIRAEEYPFHGAKLHGHKSYGALEFNLAAEYPLLNQARSKKKKRQTLPHMAAAAMCTAAVVFTVAAAAPSAAPVPPERPAVSASAEASTLPEPTSPEIAPSDPTVPPTVHIHNYASQTIREPSCSEEGTVRYVCDCGEEYTESIPTTEHTPEVIPGEEATCQAPGLTEGERCSVCGEILTPQEEIPQLEHTPVQIWGVTPTCTQPGLTNGTKCSVCGTILTARRTIAATGHLNIVEIPERAPTCTAAGLTSGKKCADCGAILVGQSTLSPTGHRHITEFSGRDPSCTEVGLTPGKKCADCGAILSGMEEIPKSEHEIEPIPDSASTCVVNGTHGGTRCAICGTIIELPELLPLADHQWDSVLVGSSYRVRCIVCGINYEDFIAEPVIPTEGAG